VQLRERMDKEQYLEQAQMLDVQQTDPKAIIE
jgi:hypothetical protein